MTAVDKKYENCEDFELVDEMTKITGVKIPQAIEEIRNAEVLHKTICEPEDMQKTVENFLGL